MDRDLRWWPIINHLLSCIHHLDQSHRLVSIYNCTKNKLFHFFSKCDQIRSCDNGGLFTSNEMESFRKINGITHNKTTLLWPKQMGKMSELMALLILPVLCV